MTRPRKALISADSTPFYHCVSRCVRRAYLCGFDGLTQRSFEHRRGWIVERIKVLSTIFTVDVAAYAVMSNHFHVLLRVDEHRSRTMSARDVLERWGNLFKGPLLMQRFLAGEVLSDAESDLIDTLCDIYRKRLSSISWFMRCLNEPIARSANAEDGCRGRFWEGRFTCQALLDETALLTCMTYVDLNPVRAGIAETPETSEFTSIQERILAHKADSESRANAPSTSSASKLQLLAFSDAIGNDDHHVRIPFRLGDYLTLVDWSGRAFRAGKSGRIPPDIPPILERLKIDPVQWVESTRLYRSRFHRALGSVEAMRAYCKQIGAQWLQGQRHCAQLYRNANFKAVPDPF
jgi:REP element-mobilizing transposase RayT